MRVTRSQAVATVDGDAVAIQRSPPRGPGERFGLQAGDYESYRIQATGEAVQLDTGAPEPYRL